MLVAGVVGFLVGVSLLGFVLILMWGIQSVIIRNGGWEKSSTKQLQRMAPPTAITAKSIIIAAMPRNIFLGMLQQIFFSWQRFRPIRRLPQNLLFSPQAVLVPLIGTLESFLLYFLVLPVLFNFTACFEVDSSIDDHITSISSLSL